MGNQQSNKTQQIKPQPVKQVIVASKKTQNNKQQFEDQIKLQNSKNKNVKQSTKQNKQTQIEKKTNKNQQKNSDQKSSVNKDLPPLRMRNSRTITVPLGTNQNLTNQPNNSDDLEQVNIQKNIRTNQRVDSINQGLKCDQQNNQNQKQNQTNARPKKFRPSQQSRKNTSTLSSYSNLASKNQMKIQND